MKRTEAEKELIEFIRHSPSPSTVTIQRHENGEWIVCTIEPPINAASADTGVGFRFDEAWRGRKKLATYQAAAKLVL